MTILRTADGAIIAINPGTEDVGQPREDDARRSVWLLVRDLRRRGLDADWPEPRSLEDDGRGFYVTTVTVDGRPHEVDMPGVHPALVRRGEPWVSPRLYVDGSSWLWQYALGAFEYDEEEDT